MDRTVFVNELCCTALKQTTWLLQMPAMLQVALASNQKATQLVPLEGSKKGGALLAGLLQRSASKHKLKMSKKKPFSLFQQSGSPIDSDEQVQNLRAGDSLILCTTEGDRREVHSLSTTSLLAALPVGAHTG